MARGMNERIQKLREISVNTPVHIDLERARIETEVYKEWEGKVSIPVLRSLSLKEYFSRKTLYLGEGELIVGEKGCDPQASPTFPEICCHSIEDMVVMSERELVSFHTTDEDRRIQAEEIIPFWTGKATRDKVLAAMTPEWKKCYGAGMFTEFMEQRGPGHTCGGEQVFTTGFMDYKAQIKESMEALDFFNDPEAYDKMEELKGMDIACDAIIILGERYHKLVLETAEKETDEVRKAELMQIAANLEVVPAHAPQTYWQAIQLYWFAHLGVTTDLNPWDAFSPGRMDQHL
ncbi:MAG: pyruvate formate lyase family protein, partial [Clostridiales bacterium]|nr:pyruvate formate lyase family protein [Candidatus Crickella merdequi]